MKNLQKIIIAILVFNVIFTPNLKASACKATRDAYRAATAGHHRFPWEIVALGTVYSSEATNYALYNIIHDIPKLRNWAEISKFDEKIVVDTNNIANVFDNNEIPVKLLKNSINKTNIAFEDKTFLVENLDIKNNALHLHYIKIPDELANSKQKLVAETIFIYENNDKNSKLDFGFFKNARLRHLESIAGQKQDKILKTNENNNVCCIQKEYKVNSSDKPFVLAVYSPQSKKIQKTDEKTQFSCGKYVAFVKFKVAN